MPNEPTEEDILIAMQAYGGTFVQRLGQVFRVADAHNQARLRAAFPDVFEKYRDIAVLKASMK